MLSEVRQVLLLARAHPRPPARCGARLSAHRPVRDRLGRASTLASLARSPVPWCPAGALPIAVCFNRFSRLRANFVAINSSRLAIDRSIKKEGQCEGGKEGRKTRARRPSGEWVRRGGWGSWSMDF